MEQTELLFSRLDFSRPALAGAGALLNSGDKDGALRAVIRHFRNRQTPQYLYGDVEADAIHDPELVKEAEEVCAHRLFGYELGEDIDWHENKTKDTTNDPEWIISLTRHNYWGTLARAYRMTGDEKYAREFVSQLKSFTRQCPAEPFMAIETEELPKPNDGNPAWRTIDTAIRVYTAWLPVLFYFRRSPAFDGDAWLRYLNGLHDHGEFLHSHYSNHLHCANWVAMESSALFQLGVLFPEFRCADRWRSLGYRRMCHEMRYQFDQDGAHMERTPVYHLVAANAFLQSYRIASVNGIAVPPYMLPMLEKAAEFLLLLMKPDLSLPCIGDADRNSLTDRKADRALYEGMNLTLDPQDMNELRAFFRTMHGLTGREDFLYLAACRKEGRPPARRNVDLRESGFYVLRSGWNAEDSYALLAGTQVERGTPSWHSHPDAGHIELQVCGEDVLVDSGRFIYHCDAREWNEYFFSGRAHNIVEVDRKNMGRIPGVSAAVRGVRTYCHRFESGPGLDALVISHNGYCCLQNPVFHLRRFLHFKPGLYLVDDILTGEGEHTYDLHFHFAPGHVTPHPDGNISEPATFRGKHVEVDILPLLADGVGATLVEGSESPVQGWIAIAYGNKAPAPVMTYTQTGGLPARFLTALTVRNTGSSAAVLHRDANEIRLHIESGVEKWNARLGPETWCAAPDGGSGTGLRAQK